MSQCFQTWWRDYFKSLAFGVGFFGGSTCGLGLGLQIVSPLSGFASLFLFIAASSLTFAGFTSCASYFSITEDVRRRIRESTGFFASMGEAEKSISIDRQLSGFYDRFFNLAKESAAVEASALTKDEIYSYAKALKESGKP